MLRTRSRGVPPVQRSNSSNGAMQEASAMANVRRLPGPIADIWEWQLMGLCRGRDSAQFFHPDGERGSSRNRRELKAKALCAVCPVRPECAAHALATHEPYGVWGGSTEAEGAALRERVEAARRRLD